MHIGICDANASDLKSLRELLDSVAPKHTADAWPDGGQLLAAISGGLQYDLLFLDIILPDMSGMDLAWKIRELAPETAVVFLTESNAHAIEAFAVRALHYIVKPMTEPALKECLQRLAERQCTRKRVHIISSSGIQYMPFVDEILFAQSDAHYNHLHLSDGTVIRIRMTQSEIQDMLGNTFLPVSRGLIVNVEFIRQLAPKSCTLKDGREILLSRNNVDQIHAAYVFSQLSRHGG